MTGDGKGETGTETGDGKGETQEGEGEGETGVTGTETGDGKGETGKTGAETGVGIGEGTGDFVPKISMGSNTLGTWNIDRGF